MNYFHCLYNVLLSTFLSTGVQYNLNLIFMWRWRGIFFHHDDLLLNFEHTGLKSTLFIAVCKECFEFFDKDHSGAIEKAELITVMRAVGLNPSKKDVEKMIKSVAEKGKM